MIGFCSLGTPVTIGISLEATNSSYHYSAGTAPWAICIAAILLAFYLLLMRSKVDVSGPPMRGLLRRFVAFWLDVCFAIFIMAPVLGLIPMLSEWHRTGIFQWTFSRDTPARGDVLLDIASLLIAFILLGAYFTWPLMRQRPSPGACVCGYQIVTEGGAPMTFKSALLRSLPGFVALCGWFLEPFRPRHKEKGKFRLDDKFKTRAVKLQ